MANTYSRGQMERAIARFLLVHPEFKKGSIEEVPVDVKTDLSGLPTFGDLRTAYLATFPEGTTPETHVTVKDRIWLAKFRKAGIPPTPAEQKRLDKIMAVVGPEETKAAARRAERLAAGPSQAAFDKRDTIVTAARKGKVSEKVIAEMLEAANLPGVEVKRPKVVKKAAPAAQAVATV